MTGVDGVERSAVPAEERTARAAAATDSRLDRGRPNGLSLIRSRPPNVRGDLATVRR